MSIWQDMRMVFAGTEAQVSRVSDEPHSLDNIMKQAGYDPEALIYSGGTMSRDKAATMSAIHRAVSLISGSAADAIVDSIHVVDRDSGKKITSAKSTYIVDLLRDTPDGMNCAHTFIEDAMTDLLLSGNAIFLKNPSAVNSNRHRLELCNPVNATAVEGPDGDLLHLIPDTSRTGAYERFKPYQVIISRWPRINGRHVGGSASRDRYFARPPIMTLKNAILLALGAERWASAMFDNRSSSVGNDFAIMCDNHLTAEQQELLFQYLVEFGKGRAPLVLGGGMKIEKMGVSAADADLQNLRAYQLSEVARIYGVPSVLIGAEGSGQTWGSSIAQLHLGYQRYSLRQHLNRLLEPMSYHLLPRNERLVVDESRAFRGDAESLSRLIDSSKPSNGSDAVLSRQEMRALFGMHEPYINDWDDKEAGNGIA